MIESPKPEVQSPKGLPGIVLLAALFAQGCASTRVSARDAFPLDPREELSGPFSAVVESGWQALSQGGALRAVDRVRALAAAALGGE